jgi:hypothetical protein
VIVALCTTTALALRNNPGRGAEHCSRPYFWPLKQTPITTYLQQRIGVHSGAAFKGAAATFYDTRGKASIGWPDVLTPAAMIWHRTGNDMQSLGLWRFNIPTLFEVNAALTPPYFLMLTEFLSRPADWHSRGMVTFTRPNLPILTLWGVRFVISDFLLAPAVEKLQMDVDPSNPPYYNTPLRLHELPDANLGNYSPEDVIRADTAGEIIARMKDTEFNAKRTVIVETPLEGSFSPARDVTLTVVRGGVDVRAIGGADSLLVLPAQYSHCWQIEGAPSVSIFRANLLQLGVRFSGELNARLRFRFGLFWNSGCRLDDVKDMQRLRLSDARNR